jgi:hypothetical protein
MFSHEKALHMAMATFYKAVAQSVLLCYGSDGILSFS